MERIARPKCNICHFYKYLKDVKASDLSKKERERLFHDCTKIPCTNFKTCPTKWLAVSICIFLLLFFQKHPKARSKMRKQKALEREKKKEIINLKKGKI